MLSWFETMASVQRYANPNKEGSYLSISKAHHIAGTYEDPEKAEAEPTRVTKAAENFIVLWMSRRMEL
jgi:hypothetical protein